MASVELRALKKAFGAVEVIHGIDMNIQEGEFVALVGPSGCGKSTLLRIIAGLEDATDGEVLIGGDVVTERSPRERNIAMVFQNYALYPHMTVAQNLAFNLKLSGNSRSEIARKVGEAARLLEISDLLSRRPAQLSGGQRQRVAMGRAIVRDPAVFLFDEPLSNLDAKLRVQMRSEIKSLHHKVRTTSIYVTHDQIEAMTLADRVVVLNKGRVEQQGSPLELYREPANTFVAGFIGSPAMNFLDAIVEGGAAGLVARLGNSLQIAIDATLGVSVGQPIIIGIRPEHLLPHGAGSPVSGVVEMVEPTGAQTHVTFRIGDDRVVAVTEGGQLTAMGGTFNASVAPEVVHVFHKQSGERLKPRVLTNPSD